MALEDELFDIEQGFWLSGEEHFTRHLDDQCLLAFPQTGEMHGVFSREHVAATATPSNRWRDLRMAGRHLLRADNAVAIIGLGQPLHPEQGQRRFGPGFSVFGYKLHVVRPSGRSGRIIGHGARFE